jgi:hypothetical protein
VSTSRTRLTVTLTEIFQALIERGVAEVTGFTRSAVLAPGQTVIFEENVPPGKVYVVAAVKINSSPNHANAFAFFFDTDTPKLVDDSVIQERYDGTFFFLPMGALLTARKFIRTRVVNISNTQSFFSFFAVAGFTDATTWRRLSESYFRIFKQEVFGE